MLLDRAAAPPVNTAVPPRRGRPRLGRRLLVGAVAIGAAGVGLSAVTGWGNPFEGKVVDRSTTPLLLALDDLDEYHAATGTFQVIIDQERDTAYVPSWVSGERTQLLATGTVDAHVDFTDLDEDGVQLSADGNSATITLPAPELGDPSVDPAQSRVLDRDRGLVQRVGDALEDDTTDDTALYEAAEHELAGAAVDSDLRDRAEKNTREMLTGLSRSLGVEKVTVTFAAAPA